VSILDNPSLDTGAVANPFIPYGWVNSGLDVGDSETEAVIRHSEGASLQFNVGAVAGEKITQQLILASGKYFHFGAWTYGDGAGAGFKLNCVNAVLASNPAVSSLDTPHTATWSKTWAVWRATGANPTVEIEADSGAGAERYVDDIQLEVCDDVTLTATPASLANSLESGGIRNDGLDRLTQPIPSGLIFAANGILRFRTIPRHSAATAALFGNLTPRIGVSYRDANNLLDVYWSAANTITLNTIIGGVALAGNYNATGRIVADISYLFEFVYTPAMVLLKLNGVTVITVVRPVNFGANIPNVFYAGSTAAFVQQADAVYLAV